MTLPASGQISLWDVCAETGRPASNIGLGDSQTAALAGQEFAGLVSMSDLWGKTIGGISDIHESWEQGYDGYWGNYVWRRYQFSHSVPHGFVGLEVTEIPSLCAYDILQTGHPAILRVRASQPFVGNRSGRFKGWLTTTTGARFYFDRGVNVSSTPPDYGGN